MAWAASSRTASPCRRAICVDRAHLGGLAVKMDGDDRLGSRCDGRLDLRRVDVVGVGLDVHEDRPGTGPPDRARRGEEGVGRGDHLVSRPDAHGQQRQQEGVGARGATDSARQPAILGHLGLEPGDFRPEHEHLALEHLADDRLDLIADGLVLRLQVEGGYMTGSWERLIGDHSFDASGWYAWTRTCAKCT